MTFMSGYGGITFAMSPNGLTYYSISDNGEYGTWHDTIADAHYNIAANCTPPPPTGDDMHTEDITVQVVSTGGPWYKGEATVTILDAGGAPVSGVTVDASFVVPSETTGSVSGTTNASGQVTLQSPRKKHASNGYWKLCVDDVSKSGWTWDSGADVETCDQTP